VLVLRRPSASVLAEILAEAKQATLTYPEVGATKSGLLPSGYRHDAEQTRLGGSTGVFEMAVAALRGWRAQIGAGIEITPAGAWVEAGETVVLLIRSAGLWATAPCRVVYVSDESDRFTFAYGTLPGHPEMGEVSFTITRNTAGDVVFEVASFSRPVDPLARLAAPLTRRIQRGVTKRYLAAIAGAASPEVTRTAQEA